MESEDMEKVCANQQGNLTNKVYEQFKRSVVFTKFPLQTCNTHTQRIC